MEIIKKWTLWSNVSTNRKIFSATLVIASFTLGAKLVATARELVVAASFGTADALDAFLVAFVVPSLAISVISGSFNAAFMPTYIQVRERGGAHSAQKLLGSVITSSTLLLTAATILMIVTAPYYLPFIASGFSADKMLQTRMFIYLLSPIVIITGINTIWSAVLNAGEEFGLVAITPVVTPFVVIAFLVFGKSWGVTALALGTVAGMLLEAGIICTALLRKQISPWPTWHWEEPHLSQVMRQYIPMVSGSLILGSTAIINQAMAAMLGSGSVAVLNYGSKLIAVPLGIGTTALGTAVIPYFSVMVAKNEWQQIRHTLRRYSALVFAVATPVAISLFFGSELLVRVIYQRGAFRAADTHAVAGVLAFFALQLPFYAAAMLLVRLISATLANHILMISSVVSAILNVTLNYLFMKKLGVAGIALSTSCVYLGTYIFLYFSWRWISRNYR